MWYLRTLGQLSLHSEGPGSAPVLRNAKALAILAYLACAPGHTVRREHLASLLWPGADSRRGRRSLRQALYYLSKKADGRLVRADDERLALATDRLTVDLWSYERALEEECWEEAVELYGGSFLGGYGGKAGREFEGWIETKNERVWAGFKAACHELVEGALEEGEPDEAVRHAERYVELNPLDERAQRTRIEALLEAGDRVGAYQAYESYRALVREELDDVPTEELRARVEPLRQALFAEPVRRPASGTSPADASDPDEASRSAGTAGSGGDAVGGAEAGTSAERGEPPASGAGGGRRPGLPGLLRWAVAAGGAIIVIGVVLVSGWSVRAGAAGSATAWASLEAELLLERDARDPADSERLWSLRVEDGQARLERTAMHRKSRPEPGGGRVATVERVEDGWSVHLREAGHGGLRPLTRRPHDEAVEDWAPDGGRVLYRYGSPGEDHRAYVWGLAHVDPASGRRTVLPVPRTPETGGARWSPAGPWIAFEADRDGRGDVFLVRPDGTGLRNLTDRPSHEADPAWSPDGEWLAFTSDRDGTRDLHVVRPDGSGEERITFGPADEWSPVWLSAGHVAFLSDREGRVDVWALDLSTRKVRRLTRGAAPRKLIHRRRHEAPPATIEAVEITPATAEVSPGQWLPLEAGARRVADTSTVTPSTPVRWSVSDTSVLARTGLEEGPLFRVRETGGATVIADLGGWRADTLRLTSGPLMARSLAPALLEDWSGGLDRSRWIAFGRPRPEIVDAGPTARFRHRFRSNGDDHYTSGAATARAFPLADGLTIELWARLPFTGRNYENLDVTVLDRPPRRDEPPWSVRDELLPRLRIVGSKDRHYLLVGTSIRLAFPGLEDPERWHRYALQLEPDGRVSLVVDGRLALRTGAGAWDAGIEEGRAAVHGNTLTADLDVGPVAVYPGVKYRIADPRRARAPRPAPPRR